LKKYLIFILFSLVVNNLSANILERLAEITEKNHLRCYYDGWGYKFSLYMNGNDLTVGYFGGEEYGGELSIVAYKIVNNSIRVIVQNRTYEFVEPIYNKRFSTTIDMNKYVLVELEEIDGKIENFCNRIDEINLNGFIINNAVIYKETEARLGPSMQWNTAIKLNVGNSIKVTGVNKQGDDAYNTFDYWYKVIINNKTYWVFGFYIIFEDKIKIL